MRWIEEVVAPDADHDVQVALFDLREPRVRKQRLAKRRAKEGKAMSDCPAGQKTDRILNGGHGFRVAVLVNDFESYGRSRGSAPR
ncbi:hypothetical protein RGR602_PC01786 (plasmid) [Rhizobium gallicum bv. gallicum R602sp]|uniref:Uncharacterized protein n=1 Tax=Rhizobium gallicum bv. gallicum R602sp TaxID=1041138 RepID=A0A0B4XGD4_9HYPH|nr:hypothetical protein RGR602_PC01786 [Rhizobium gallicum bv. gallicum R602sp]